MLRPATPADITTLVDLATSTGVFKPIELVALREVLDEYHATNRALGHECVVDETEGLLRGFAYYAPAAMTDRTWYLYWIAVRPELHGQQIGSALLAHVETQIKAKQGRMLLVETSSTPHYEATRGFYAKNGYERTAYLPDYYSDGDSMVVFRMRLDETTSMDSD